MTTNIDSDDVSSITTTEDINDLEESSSEELSDEEEYRKMQNETQIRKNLTKLSFALFRGFVDKKDETMMERYSIIRRARRIYEKNIYQLMNKCDDALDSKANFYKLRDIYTEIKFDHYCVKETYKAIIESVKNHKTTWFKDELNRKCLERTLFYDDFVFKIQFDY